MRSPGSSASWNDGGRVLTGRELQALSDEELRRRVEDIRVYARVDPGAENPHRRRPAGRRRDRRDDRRRRERRAGADARRHRRRHGQGRHRRRPRGRRAWCCSTTTSPPSSPRCAKAARIYDNIRKFVRFIVTCNSAEIWTIFLAPFLGLPLPLLPIQILWMNLVTDGLPGLALAAEPAERDVMQPPAAAPTEGLFARGMAWQVIWVGSADGRRDAATQAFAIMPGASTGRPWSLPC